MRSALGKAIRPLARSLAKPLRRLTGRDHPMVAVVRLAGVISAMPTPGRGSLNLAGLAEPLERAFSLGGVKAVALAVNSPGGSPVQSALIHKRIRALAAEKELPVFAFAEDVAASGGYWLATAADEIYADENSILGSIGVVSAGFGFTGVIEKLGVERRLYTEGDNKAMLDPFLPEDPEDVARLHAIQKDIHDSFKALVRERRGDKLPKRNVNRLFTGDVWTGPKALELGLIDGLGDMRGVLRERFGDKVKLRVFGPRQGWLQRRFGITAPPRSDPADWATALLDTALARAHWSRFGL